MIGYFMGASHHRSEVRILEFVELAVTIPSPPSSSIASAPRFLCGPHTWPFQPHPANRFEGLRPGLFFRLEIFNNIAPSDVRDGSSVAEEPRVAYLARRPRRLFV